MSLSALMLTNYKKKSKLNIKQEKKTTEINKTGNKKQQKS